MNNFINILIYLIYLSIAALSIIISLKASIILCLMVVPIELIRILAIYKKLYKFLFLVIAFNLSLIGYTGYKLEIVTKANNQVVASKNQIINHYTKNTWLKADTLQRFLNQTQSSSEVDINFWVIVAAYAWFEILMFMFLRELNKQEKKSFKKLGKQEKATKVKALTKPEKLSPVPTDATTNLTLIGSYLEYAKANNLSRKEAKHLFEGWDKQGLIVKQNRKNYLKADAKRI